VKDDTLQDTIQHR